MTRLLYSISVIIFTILIFLVSPFNNKARLWVQGRKRWRKNLNEQINPEDKKIWIHCASLGEFEQGRPIIEKIKEKTPEYKILLTFFSPSGYEIRKNWPLADYVCYLPADTLVNSSQFIDIVNPSMVLFIKYEFWNNYLSALHRKKIPFYLVSGIFRPEQHFFRWYGRFFRSILKKFTYIFVQDNKSVDLLRGIGITNVSFSGDTRFDRVSQIAGEAKTLPVVERFKGSEKIFLAGSSWRPDEEIIASYVNNFPDKMKWIFAPHITNKSNIERLEKLFKVKVAKYSESFDGFDDARVLIIDNIGMLSSAYKYADVAEVGGGFGKGIHNILEPACWGIPVLFGPNHTKFREAEDLIHGNGAFTFKNYDEFKKILDKLLEDQVMYENASITVSDYIKNNTGATEKVLAKVLEGRY
jgi:3-deoxy-D-manno-octulosonic-acid transferase